MLKEEFEKLAGYEVSLDDYRTIIEPMYLASPLDKSDFVKCLDKKRFALPSRSKVEKEIIHLAEQLRLTCTHYHDEDLEDEMYLKIYEYGQRFYPSCEWFVDDEQIHSCYYPKKVSFYFNLKKRGELILNR